MLVIQGVTKAYGDRQILGGVTFSVRPGEIASLLGPNGAGKTTLLSIIAGLLTPDAGQVTICGHDVAADRCRAIDCLGIAPQETAVQLLLTTRENLRFYAELSGIRRRDVALRVEWAIEALELGEFADQKAQKLSGGQRRRLHTAIAMIGRAPVLLLDEPTVGSDLAARSRLLEVIRGLADQGTTVLYTTHYLPEVEELGARILMLDSGRIIADGALQELLEDHGTSAMELTFNGEVPELWHPRARIETHGSIARVTADAIAEVAGDLLGSLGADSARLAKVEMLNGSLDSVYLALTGRRYSEDALDPTVANPTDHGGESAVLDLTTSHPVIDLTEAAS